MVAEGLLEEVEERRKKTIQMLESEYSAKKDEVAKKTEEQKAFILETAKTDGRAAAQREKIRIAGAAKLQAKKLIFDATERMLEANVAALQGVLADFTSSKDYHPMLAKMVAYADRRLGGSISLRCRPEDAAALKKLAVTVSSSDLQTMGGFKATNREGTLELDLTFEELLRERDDQAKAMILGKA